MAARPRPTARRIELGHELRRLRRLAGLTIEEAAKGLPFSESKLQRVETGMQDLRNSSYLRRLLARYGLDDEEGVDHLLEIQRQASSQEWWHTDYRDAMPSDLERFVGIESAATSMRAFHPVVVFGLLQAESYARALFETAKPINETTTELVQQSVQLRMKRKESLTSEEAPVKLWAVLNEAALRQVVGGIDVMREQYEEITKLASLDNVTVQVLPMEGRRYRSIDNFIILELGDDLPPVVQVDNAWGAMSVSDRPREVGRFTRKFNALVASALSPEETPGFLQRLSREINE